MTIKARQATLRVEAASSLASQVKGLSDRSEIGNIDGMLFLYDDSQPRNFWMKNMLFPLDAVWINKGKIIGWQENIPPPEDAGGEIIRFASPEPADAVLEAPAGWVQAHNLKVGDGVDWEED